MKKATALILTLALLLSLCACGAAPQGETTAPTAETEAPAETTVPETEAPTEPEEPFVIEPTVVVDDDVCKIEVTGGELTDGKLFSIDVAFENKTADQEISFRGGWVTVNGYMCNGDVDAVSEDEKVGPGERKEVKGYIYQHGHTPYPEYSLKAVGITKYTDISIRFLIDKGKGYDHRESVTARVYPYGEENVISYVRESKPNDQILADNEFVSVIATGEGHYEAGSYYADVYLVNKTEKDVSFTNGYLLSEETRTAINGKEYQGDAYILTAFTLPETGYYAQMWIGNQVLSELEIADGEDIYEIIFTLVAEEQRYNIFSDHTAYFQDEVTIKY